MSKLQGSVKDLLIDEKPSYVKTGIGRFYFTDRFSVFDWGEMPDHIKYKGASLCMMSAYFFEQLAKLGISTHYLGITDGVRTTTERIDRPSSEMAILLVNAVKPPRTNGRYDYSAFHNMKGNFVIPLEVIYRNALPKGSSVFRRLGLGSLTLRSMGLTAEPAEGARLLQPFIDVSTKYEKFDRYPDERMGESRIMFFRELAGLSDAEIEELEGTALAANSVITEGVSRAGLLNDDGKFEFAYTPSRRLMMADAVGTLDECRFTSTLDGQLTEVSKEIPRQWYRRMQPEWVEEIEAAKKSGERNWKALVKRQPKNMPPELAEIVSHVYAATANAVLQKQLFDAPPLDEVVQEYKRFRELATG